MNAATAVRRIANNPVHTKIYNTFFRNTSTMVATAIVGSLVLETVVDSSVNQAWNIANQGRRFEDMIAERKAKGLPVE